MSLGALQRRVAKLENVRKPRLSPFIIWFGSLDVFINVCVIPDIAEGKLDALDMVDIVAVLRRWEADGTWDRPHAY